MKILSLHKVADCFDDRIVKDAILDTELTKELIHKLGKLGKLLYFDQLAQPFFKITLPNDSIIKGVEGKSKVRLEAENDKAFIALSDSIASI
jgi:hypothetical protein